MYIFYVKHNNIIGCISRVRCTQYFIGTCRTLYPETVTLTLEFNNIIYKHKKKYTNTDPIYYIRCHVYSFNIFRHILWLWTVGFTYIIILPRRIFEFFHYPNIGKDKGKVIVLCSLPVKLYSSKQSIVPNGFIIGFCIFILIFFLYIYKPLCY